MTTKEETHISADLRGALTPTKTEHFAAITQANQVGQLLRQLEAYEGSYIVKSAIQIAPFVFVRPSELRYALWQDIDFDQAEWRFTAPKTNHQHIVPLAKGVIKSAVTYAAIFQ